MFFRFRVCLMNATAKCVTHWELCSVHSSRTYTKISDRSMSHTPLTLNLSQLGRKSLQFLSIFFVFLFFVSNAVLRRKVFRWACRRVFCSRLAERVISLLPLFLLLFCVWIKIENNLIFIVNCGCSCCCCLAKWQFLYLSLTRCKALDKKNYYFDFFLYVFNK